MRWGSSYKFHSIVVLALFAFLSGVPVVLAQHPPGSSALIFLSNNLSRNGQQAVFVTRNPDKQRQYMFVYDVATDQLRAIRQPPGWQVEYAAFSPDDRKLAASAMCTSDCPSDRSRQSAVFEYSFSTDSWRELVVGAGRRSRPAYTDDSRVIIAAHAEADLRRLSGQVDISCQVFIWIDVGSRTETELMPRDDCFFLLFDATPTHDGSLAFSARSPQNTKMRQQAKALDLPGGATAIAAWTARIFVGPGGQRKLTDFAVAPVMASRSMQTATFYLAAAKSGLWAFIVSVPGPDGASLPRAQHDIFVRSTEGLVSRLTEFRTVIIDGSMSRDGSRILAQVDVTRRRQGDFALTDTFARSTKWLGVSARMMEISDAD